MMMTIATTTMMMMITMMAMANPARATRARVALSRATIMMMRLDKDDIKVRVA
jgi:hypothetical protein